MNWTVWIDWDDDDHVTIFRHWNHSLYLSFIPQMNPIRSFSKLFLSVVRCNSIRKPNAFRQNDVAIWIFMHPIL
jgi:hypothetical protein